MFDLSTLAFRIDFGFKYTSFFVFIKFLKLESQYHRIYIYLYVYTYRKQNDKKYIYYNYDMGQELFLVYCTLVTR